MIQNDFTFCDPKEKSLIDISKSCVKEKSHKEIIKIPRIGIYRNNMAQVENEQKIFVFDHAKHLISGMAHECSMTISSVTTYKNFFGQNFRPRFGLTDRSVIFVDLVFNFDDFG